MKMSKIKELQNCITSCIELHYKNKANMHHCITGKLVAITQQWIIISCNSDMELPIRHTNIIDFKKIE